MTAKEIVKKYFAQKEIFMTELKKAFGEESKKLFDKYPNMGDFSFTAYTPYFNDGDTCEYNVHTDYPDIHNLFGDKFEYKYGSKEYKEIYEPMRDDIAEFLGTFPDEFYMDAFGDHVKITVYKDKVEETEYDHD